ncbi:hypothetical protein ACFPH6_31160 [Streptomyces xiangluensis]|uniref:Secreted protein n=1 Tax=Streptomyces xiangluensis TaxID=2665720 RepID=A0ABV8YYE4_9ACTN
MPQLIRNPYARAGAVVGALGLALTAGMSATPASADSSGRVFSRGGGAEGWYYYGSERVYSCDIKRDGYSALTQVYGYGGRLLVSVKDQRANGACSWKKPTLFEGTHKIRVCVVKNAAPTKCSAKREWYVD